MLKAKIHGTKVTFITKEAIYENEVYLDCLGHYFFILGGGALIL